jgi:hypothetical protein
MITEIVRIHGNVQSMLSAFDPARLVHVAPKSIVLPSGKKDLAMQLIFTLTIWPNGATQKIAPELKIVSE